MPYIDEALLDDPEELQRKDSRDTLRALASARRATKWISYPR